MKILTSLATIAFVMTSYEGFSQDRSYESIRATGGVGSTSVGVNLTSTAIDITDENAFGFGAFGDFHMSP
ncbi:MAG: hypothetical protein M3Q07_24540, partial [Pseudobdellovibrionaceae bacterium]|nr:hypothetical protein [Pseudobdellovibrionaceae bacterium]